MEASGQCALRVAEGRILKEGYELVWNAGVAIEPVS